MRIKLLNERAQIPTQATPGSAGYDLYAANELPIVIEPGETTSIPLGFATEIPVNLFGAIYARSGLAVNEGLRPANCVGIIDSDYRGEWMVVLHNDSGAYRTINPGEKIAQVVFSNYIVQSFEPVNEISSTERGEGGFGSTGI